VVGGGVPKTFESSPKGKSKHIEQGNEKQFGRMGCLETLELIYTSPSRPGKRPRYP
jgi:hypothetical protein